MGEWKTFFVYTKRERQAVVLLLSITILLLAVPHFFEPPLIPSSRGLPLPVVTVTKEDSVVATPEGTVFHNGHIEGSMSGSRLFMFDPNRVTMSELTALGVSEKAASVIIHYRQKGGRFKKAEDLSKIYSIRPELYRRLLPYVRISDDGRARSPYVVDSMKRKATYVSAKPRLEPIEINSATQAEWESLPGIGMKLAVRILTFREKLGGFLNAGQVKETYGITDSVFDVILPFLKCSNPTVKLVDLNNVTIDELKQHPYFRGRIAYAIIRYREQHGKFRTLDELKNLQVLDETERRKIEPYIALKSG